jgi:hypothetical protein
VSRRPIAIVTVLKQPHIAPDAVRIEIECPASCTGLTSIPGPAFALTRAQMVTAATFEHESRCGECSTEVAHAQGDQQVKAMTDRAWDDLLAAAGRRYVEGRRN